MKKMMIMFLILVVVVLMTACSMVDHQSLLPLLGIESAEAELPSGGETEAPSLKPPFERETEAPSLKLPFERETKVSATEQPSVCETEVPAAEEIPSVWDQTPAAPMENNYFYNDTNFAPDIGSVSVKPRCVRYEDGMLVAECFVINGLNTVVYQIEVTSLAFYDGDNQLIASASFGPLQNLSIGAGQYAIWTFTFAADTVANSSANLSFLRCVADTTYHH